MIFKWKVAKEKIQKVLSAVAIELPQMVVGRSGSKKQWVGGKNGVGNLAWGQKWERGRRSVVSEIVAEIETETKLMLAWLGNVERLNFFLEIVEEKETKLWQKQEKLKRRKQN